MQKYLDKASTLIEALPYIRKFNAKIVVIKYGGSAMENERLMISVMQDIALLKLVGLKPVIIHGGGKEITALCESLGVKSEFKNGLRISSKEAVNVAEMALYKINKNLVQNLQCQGVRAIGLCGKDAGLIECEQRDEELGFVGQIVAVKGEVLRDLLEKDFLPIIAPIGMDEDYNSYNINADDVACAVARSLRAEKLVFLSDVEGVYKDYTDKNSLISKLSIEEVKELAKKTQGGMLVKLNSCVEACQNGVKKVHILDGRVEHSLLLEIFTDRGIGTLIG